MKPARVIALLLAVASLAFAAACGQEGEVPDGTSQQSSEAETEGLYVDVDRLKYQIQLSRQVNPFIVSDRSFFVGVSAGDMDLGRDEEWFGVWLRVENETDRPIPNATEIEIVDTQENVYRPVSIAEENTLAYRAAEVPGEALYPLVDSAASERTPQGALLLFRIRRFSLENRPLELKIHGRQSDEEATIAIDV